jgi:hypothetical protein
MKFTCYLVITRISIFESTAILENFANAIGINKYYKIHFKGIIIYPYCKLKIFIFIFVLDIKYSKLIKCYTSKMKIEFSSKLFGYKLFDNGYI